MPRERQWTASIPEPQEKRDDFEEHVVEIGRISRTVAGGKRMRFRAVVVVGNRQGKVGIATAKALETSRAIAKATAKARKSIITVPIIEETIPFETEATYGSAHVLIKPAPPGVSIMAGGVVRAIMELAGVENVVSKILGTANRLNNARATFLALERLAKIWQQKQVGSRPKKG